MKYAYSKTAVLGLGASGEAAAKLLRSQGAHVTIFDTAPPEALADKVEALKEIGVSVMTGAEAARGEGQFDFAVLSPGIDPAVPLVRRFAEKSIAITGEVELAFQFCHKPVVAITGTNGKTTTTQLVETMLNQAGIRTLACGNIGMPFSEAVQRQHAFDAFAVEVSSFQLETISTFRPKVAVWLNFTADHLDRYPNLNAYRSAKLRIFENQTGEDFAVVNQRDPLPEMVARTTTFDAYGRSADFGWNGESILFHREPVLDLRQTHLSGLHNVENLMAALGVAHSFNLSWSAAVEGLRDYRLLPHRGEPVAEIDGVKYVNDSKATNLDALVKALESEERPIILIAGGKDKGFEFGTITQLVREKVRHAILIGEMASRIRDEWAMAVSCSLAADLRVAVCLAHSHSRPGEIVLFSPGTSSFDMFKNYADRGNQFRLLVQELKR